MHSQNMAPKCWTCVVNGHGWYYRRILESISEVGASVNRIVVMSVIEWCTSSETSKFQGVHVFVEFVVFFTFLK